jgi:hypothetical protein
VSRRGVLVAWVALAATLLAGIAWGAFPQYSWDVDNIAPGSVLRGMAARFGPAWFSSYGPVPYLMVAVVYAPMLALFRLIGELGTPSALYPWGFQHPDASVVALILAARGLSVALALLLALLAARERWSGRARDAWLVPLLMAGSPALVYYARTSNVDIYYLFFLGAAFHFAERATRVRGFLVAGAAAALAVCCKEQSAPLAAVAVAGGLWRTARAAERDGRARRAAAVVLAAIGAYLAAWMLPLHLAAWRGHHAFIFEQARYPRSFAADAAGFAALAGRALELLPVTLGWPVLAGVALAAPRPAAWSGLGARAVAAALYGIGFLGVIGYVYPRFLLPLMLLALPLAARGWSASLDRAGAAAWAIVTALLVLVALGGPMLGLVQARDPRLEARRWLDSHVAAGTVIEMAGNPRFMVRPPAGLEILSTSADSLLRSPRGPRGDVVITSGFEAYAFQRDSALRAAWWDSLTAPGGAYAPAADFHVGAWARPVRGLPIAPAVSIWTRRVPRPRRALNARERRIARGPGRRSRPRRGCDRRRRTA